MNCIEPDHHGRDKDGYPRAKYKDRLQPVSRIVWTLIYGGIPTGQWVLHECDNPQCVNPEHLYLGSYQDNNSDKAERFRVAGVNHPGYKYTDDDVYEMKIMYDDLGYTQQEIADYFNCSQSRVSELIRGLRKRVPEEFIRGDNR